MNSLGLLRHRQKYMLEHTKAERTEEQGSSRHNTRNRVGKVNALYLNIYSPSYYNKDLKWVSNIIQ